MTRLQSAESNLLILGVTFLIKVEITNQTKGNHVLNHISKLANWRWPQHHDNEHANWFPEQTRK